MVLAPVCCIETMNYIMRRHWELKIILLFSQSESLKKLSDIQDLRDRMKDVVDETRAKEELQKQLVRLMEWLFIINCFYELFLLYILLMNSWCMFLFCVLLILQIDKSVGINHWQLNTVTTYCVIHIKGHKSEKVSWRLFTHSVRYIYIFKIDDPFFLYPRHLSMSGWQRMWTARLTHVESSKLWPILGNRKMRSRRYALILILIYRHFVV